MIGQPFSASCSFFLSLVVMLSNTTLVSCPSVSPLETACCVNRLCNSLWIRQPGLPSGIANHGNYSLLAPDIQVLQSGLYYSNAPSSPRILTSLVMCLFLVSTSLACGGKQSYKYLVVLVPLSLVHPNGLGEWCSSSGT